MIKRSRFRPYASAIAVLLRCNDALVGWQMFQRDMCKYSECATAGSSCVREARPAVTPAQGITH